MSRIVVRILKKTRMARSSIWPSLFRGCHQIIKWAKKVLVSQSEKKNGRCLLEPEYSLDLIKEANPKYEGR